MRAVFRATTLILVLFAMNGCSGTDAESSPDLSASLRNALEHAERYELFSLEPDPERGRGVEDDAFHGWHVLGRTTISDPAVRQKLNEALRAGVQENDEGLVAACFEPRHGISVVDGATVTDLVICFACFSAVVYQNGEEVSGFLTTGSPQPAFDEVLGAAGIQLAKPAP